MHLTIFTPVELLDFIFRLGVIFAIYGFLWGIFELVFKIVSGTRQRSQMESYVIRGIKYILLALVTFVFCYQKDVNDSMNSTTQLILGGIVLLTYFIGKLQNQQNKNQMQRVMGMMMPNQGISHAFNNKAEILIIAIAMGVFGMLILFPNYAYNDISKWFVASILDIENTAIIGFIFKVIGFFFLLNLLSKFMQGISFILGRNQLNNNTNNRNSQSDDQFDDYEEIN